MAYFTALAVPPEVSQVLQTFRPDIRNASWTHLDDFHLTLKYLGEPAPQVLEQFEHMLKNVCAERLDIRPLRLHIFERPDLHFLVMLAECNEALHALHRQQEAFALAHGVAPHLFPQFMPHITLASYPPQPVDISAYEGAIVPTFTAESLTLYQSNKPHGTGVGRYKKLSSYLLKTV